MLEALTATLAAGSVGYVIGALTFPLVLYAMRQAWLEAREGFEVAA